MKTINPVNNFSAPRFMYLVKLGLRSKEYRFCLMGVVIMYLGFMFARLFESKYLSYDTLCDLRSYILLVLGFGVTFGASFFVSSLVSKGNRINHLMLPATTFEKLLARLTIVFVGTILTAIVIYLVLYVLFVIASVCSPNTPSYADYSPLPTIKVNLTLTGITVFQLSVFFVIFCVWINSMYLLGGILWKGKSWITMSILLIFLSMLFGEDIYGFCVDGCNKTISIMLEDTILIMLTILNGWIVWRLFSRMQVVRPTLRIFVKGIKRHF